MRFFALTNSRNSPTVSLPSPTLTNAPTIERTILYKNPSATTATVSMFPCRVIESFVMVRTVLSTARIGFADKAAKSCRPLSNFAAFRIAVTSSERG